MLFILYINLYSISQRVPIILKSTAENDFILDYCWDKKHTSTNFYLESEVKYEGFIGFR